MSGGLTAEQAKDTALMARAFQLAKAAVVTDVECEAIRLHARTGGRWYDTRPMLDHREHCPEFIDMAHEAISFGLAVGVLTADPHHAHIVRINHESL